MKNNDRLKFRTWDNKSKEYIEDGFLVSTMNNNGICEINCIKTNIGYYYSDFIIEQSTGLKDKNGKLIFEGDIIKYLDDGKTIKIKECKYINGEYLPRNFYRHCAGFPESNTDLEVIGNMHENPELLEAK